MKANLENLRREVLAHLEASGLTVFKSYPRGMELGSEAIYWDSEAFPDYREFVAAAKSVGARMMTVYSREFSADSVEDALEMLAESNLSREERRPIEIRLKELRGYEGFVCQIELSFADQQRTYIFDQPTDWYEEMEQLVDEIETSFQAPVDDAPMGGFYSNN
jgi:GTP-sensing pleiotropic transcriptional regulator CodY